MEPWTFNSAHEIANDWKLFTKTVPQKGTDYGPCGYQAELGYTRYSGDFMVKVSIIHGYQVSYIYFCFSATETIKLD